MPTNKIKSLDFKFNVKSLSETGTFEGYASVFDVVDSCDDIVARGAFAESLNNHRAAGTQPAMLWQHDSDEPIGVYLDMYEDDIGLYVKGQIALKTEGGSNAYELLKIKAINGLSIGYIVIEESYDRETDIFLLKKLELWEVSLVTFPANSFARVSNVKGRNQANAGNIDAITDLKSAEKYLRDAGISRREATAFLSQVKSLKQSDSDLISNKEILAALNSRQKFVP